MSDSSFTRRNVLKTAGSGIVGSSMLGYGVTAAGDDSDAGTDRRVWSFEVSTRSSPTVVDDTVFIGAHDTVYALDKESGDQQWAFDTGGSVSSAPAVVDGTVFVGSSDGVYAVDAASGTEQWRYETGIVDASSPTVIDGTVFIGSYDQNVYAFDAETGEEQWTFETGEMVDASPTVVDGTVFVGSLDSTVYALDAAEGNQRWAFDTAGVASSPTVVDDTVYVGSGSYVYALHADSGDQRWQFQTDESISRSSPTVSDGTLFIGCNPSVYALDAESGDQRWTFETSDMIYSSPTVVDNTVFIGSQDAHLYALEAETGDQRWAFQADGEVNSSPTVVDGTVFVGTGGGSVYALDAGVTGSSEGSRVTLGTHGHHHVWAETATLDESPEIQFQESPVPIHSSTDGTTPNITFSESVSFGGESKYLLEVSEPDSDGSVLIEPVGEESIEFGELYLNVYRPEGGLRDDPAISDFNDEVPVEVTEDTSIFAANDPVLTEFSVQLRTEDEVIDSTEFRPFTINYDGITEQDSESGDIELTFPREQVAEELHAVIFHRTSSGGIDDQQFIRGMEADGDEFTTTIDSTDIPDGEYDTVVHLYEDDTVRDDGWYVLRNIAGTTVVDNRDPLDVTGDGNPATDTTGDGLLNDVTGDGAFTIDDVEALFDNLNRNAVQDNPELFNFAGRDAPETVTVADVQALYQELQAHGGNEQ